MGYFALLNMRCTVYRLSEIQFDGAVQTTWAPVEQGTRCFLDLNFSRPGKDPVWTPDTGTAQNRAGVLFLAAASKALPGDRIVVSKGNGPKGTFVIEKAIDEAYTALTNKLHHLETYVTEVDRVYMGGDEFGGSC